MTLKMESVIFIVISKTILFTRERTADISQCHHWSPCAMTSEDGRSVEIPNWWRVTAQIWMLVLIGCCHQKHYPDLGSGASSIWNFYTCFSDVTSQKNKVVVLQKSVGFLLKLTKSFFFTNWHGVLIFKPIE